MSVQPFYTESRSHSAFDRLDAWLSDDQAHQRDECSGIATLVEDLREVTSRVKRMRARGGSFDRVDVSPYVRNLAKMVGSIEILLPPPDQE